MDTDLLKSMRSLRVSFLDGDSPVNLDMEFFLGDYLYFYIPYKKNICEMIEKCKNVLISFKDKDDKRILFQGSCQVMPEEFPIEIPKNSLIVKCEINKKLWKKKKYKN